MAKKKAIKKRKTSNIGRARKMCVPKKGKALSTCMKRVLRGGKTGRKKR